MHEKPIVQFYGAASAHRSTSLNSIHYICIDVAYVEPIYVLISHITTVKIDPI